MSYLKPAFLSLLASLFISSVTLQAQQIDESFYIPVEESELFLRVSGNAEKALILYLHGGPGGFSTLEHDLYKDSLEKDYLIAYLDQRGCGQSKNIDSTEGLNMEQYLEDLNLVINHLLSKYARDRINLMGDSWGATYSFLYLLEDQSKVNAMISNGGVANAPYSYYNLIAKERQLATDLLGNAENPTEKAEYREILAELERIEKSDFANFFEDMGKIKHEFPSKLGFNPYRVKPQGGPPSKEILDDADIDTESLMSFFGKAEIVNKAFRSDPEYNKLNILGELKQIEIPVLVIQGDSDYSIGIDQGKMIYGALSKDYPGNKYLEIINNTGHGTAGESPEIVLPVMKKFLDKYNFSRASK